MWDVQKNTHQSFSGTDYVRNNILVLISTFIYSQYMKWHLELECWTEKSAQPEEIFTFSRIHGGSLQVPAVTFVLICVVHKLVF